MQHATDKRTVKPTTREPRGKAADSGMHNKGAKGGGGGDDEEPRCTHGAAAAALRKQERTYGTPRTVNTGERLLRQGSPFAAGHREESTRPVESTFSPGTVVAQSGDD